MSSLRFFQPASTAEAQALLSASTMPIDSTTQRRIRTDESLSRYFDQGLRRPEWVWALRAAGERDPIGVVGCFGSTEGKPFLLDVLGLPPVQAVANAPVARATDRGLPLGLEEALIFAPTDTAYADDVLVGARTALDAAGWRLLVERRRYSLSPPPSSPPTPSRTSVSSGSATPRIRDSPPVIARSCVTPSTPTTAP